MKTNTNKSFDEHPRSAGLSTNPVILPVNLHSSPSPVLNVSHDRNKSTTTGTKDGEVDRNRRTKKKHGRETRSSADKVRDDVKTGPKLSETVKGKLKSSVKILKGLRIKRENKFKEIFGEIEGEKLLEASQCCLYTTAGAIPGILFISTKKVAFYSDKPISWPPSPDGVPIQKPYKVTIPTNKINEANESENMNNPAEKYMHMVTYDSFEFWFMKFKHYEKAFLNLRKALASVAK